MSPEQKETDAMPDGNGNSIANKAPESPDTNHQGSPHTAGAETANTETIEPAPGTEEAVLKKLAQKFQPETGATAQPLIGGARQTQAETQNNQPETPRQPDKKTGFARFGRKAKQEEPQAAKEEATANAAQASGQSETPDNEATSVQETVEPAARHMETAGRDLTEDHPQAEQAPGAKEAEFTETRPICGAFFKSLATIGPIALVVILALMVWPDFWQAMKGEALYCPPEVTGITAFLNSIAQQNMLEPYGMANGAFVPQWPLFTWFVGLLALIPIGADLLWPLVGMLGAALALIASWYLGLGARFGAKAAFAAGLILLCAPLFSPLGHFVGKSALAAALVIFAIACFARGLLAQRAYISLPLAFVSTGLAGLCGGVYCFALPLVASFCFLIWHGHPGRASKGDAIFGFGLLVALIGVWLGLVMLKGTNETYLATLFANSWHSPWPLPAGWWLAGFLATVGLVPWILMILGVSWLKVLARAPKTLGASRRENGSALIWISAVLAWLLTFVFETPHIAAIVIVCLLAVLLGKAFLNLSSAGNRFFFLLCAIGLIIAGLLILGLSFDFSQAWILGILPITLPQGVAEQLAGMTGLWVPGAICLVGGIVMLRYARKDHTTGGLMFATIIAIALAQPATLMIAPELGANAGNKLMTIAAIEQSLAKSLTPTQGAPAIEPKIEKSQEAPVDTQSQPENAAPAESQPENATPAESAGQAENPNPAENAPANAAPAENKTDNAGQPENAPPAESAIAPAENPPANTAPAENAGQPENDSAQKAIPEPAKAPSEATPENAETVPQTPVPQNPDAAQN